MLPQKAGARWQIYREHSDCEQVAVVAKSASAQLRVSLTNWRGSHKVESATAAIPGVFLPVANAITIDVNPLAKLRLELAEVEVHRLRLIDGQAWA
jgi:hypothetical protein